MIGPCVGRDDEKGPYVGRDDEKGPCVGRDDVKALSGAGRSERPMRGAR